MKKSPNFRTMNVKLNRIDVGHLCLLLITQCGYSTTPWMKEVHQKLVEQRDKFDRKLDEELMKQYCDKDIEVLEEVCKHEAVRNK